MARSTRLIPGFDYRTQKAVEWTLDQCREEILFVSRKGGRIVYEDGETWMVLPHDKGGLQFEIYERVKLLKEKTSDQAV